MRGPDALPSTFLCLPLPRLSCCPVAWGHGASLFLSLLAGPGPCFPALLSCGLGPHSCLLVLLHLWPGAVACLCPVLLVPCLGPYVSPGCLSGPGHDPAGDWEILITQDLISCILCCCDPRFDP